MRRGRAGLGMAVAVLALVAPFATAPIATVAADDELELLKREVERLNERIEQLERERAEPAEAEAPAEELEFRVEETEWRVDELETAVDRIDEQVGSRAVVRAFDAVQLDFGGFIDFAATHVDGEDGSVTSFNRQVAELLLRARLGDDWDVFWAQSFERKADPDFSDPARPDFPELDSVGTETVLAWANYRHTDLLQVQAGRFVTPHGIVNIDHFPAVLLDPDQPQFLRPFGGQTIFPNFTNGIQLHGATFLGSGLDADQIGYNLFAGSFAGNSTEINFGGRLEYTIGGMGLTVGANLMYGERTREVDSNYFVYGADLEYDRGRFLWTNEIFFTDEDRGDDRFAAYSQPAWRFTDRLTGFYRFDYLDRGSDPFTLAPRRQSVEHAFGLSFKPNPRVHLRTIGRHTTIDRDVDAQTAQLSATLSF